jgi:hypothetical protein
MCYDRFSFSNHANGLSTDVIALITIDYAFAFVVYWWLMLLLRFWHHSQIHDTSNQWYHLAFHMYRSTFGRCGLGGLPSCPVLDLYRHIVQVWVMDETYGTRCLLTIVRSRCIDYFGG